MHPMTSAIELWPSFPPKGSRATLNCASGLAQGLENSLGPGKLVSFLLISITVSKNVQKEWRNTSSFLIVYSSAAWAAILSGTLGLYYHCSPEELLAKIRNESAALIKLKSSKLKEI